MANPVGNHVVPFYIPSAQDVVVAFDAKVEQELQNRITKFHDSLNKANAVATDYLTKVVIKTNLIKLTQLGVNNAGGVSINYENAKHETIVDFGNMREIDDQLVFLTQTFNREREKILNFLQGIENPFGIFLTIEVSSFLGNKLTWDSKRTYLKNDFISSDRASYLLRHGAGINVEELIRQLDTQPAQNALEEQKAR